MVRGMFPPLRPSLAVVLALAAGHLLIALVPGSPLAVATNLVLFVANIYVAFCAWLAWRDGGRRGAGLFFLGYFLLLLLVLVLLGRESLFVLLAIVYASVFRVPLLLGLFVAFCLSYVLFQPYAFESLLLLSLGWLVLWQVARRGRSLFVTGSLALGLVLLGGLLLPVIHLAVAESPRTLGVVAARPDVRRALWLSLASSTLATLFLASWGIPLAWVLSRARFRGRAVLESFIDLPILVPQSVTGIALLLLLGPGAPLGQLLERAGLTVAGRFAGLVLAQAFVASPFLIKTAQTAFAAVQPSLEQAAATLGAGPARTFFRVSLPRASRGVFVGVILAWSRAISEFGAIILFAPQPLTAPVLAHNEFLRAGTSEARPVAALLLIVCLWIFVLLQFSRTLLPAPWNSRTGGAEKTR